MTQNIIDTTEFVTVAEYLRKVNSARFAKDPLAPTLYPRSVTAEIKAGRIDCEKHGRFVLVDYNKYKDYMFINYGKRK